MTFAFPSGSMGKIPPLALQYAGALAFSNAFGFTGHSTKKCNECGAEITSECGGRLIHVYLDGLAVEGDGRVKLSKVSPSTTNLDRPPVCVP